MKYIFLLFFSFSFMGTAQKPCGYKDGLQEGSCKEFYENGQVKNTIEWKNGRMEKRKVMLFFITTTGSIKTEN